jgi:hypothetical protein
LKLSALIVARNTQNGLGLIRVVVHIAENLLWIEVERLKTYNTAIDKWQHGEKMPGINEWHRYLGPCPVCGSRTFDYGGGWRCLAAYCFNSANNPAPNVGPVPDWWNTIINVQKDGNSWCAFLDGFINLQESPAEFGDTPQEAVKALRKYLKDRHCPSSFNLPEICSENEESCGDCWDKALKNQD